MCVEILLQAGIETELAQTRTGLRLKEMGVENIWGVTERTCKYSDVKKLFVLISLVFWTPQVA